MLKIIAQLSNYKKPILGLILICLISSLGIFVLGVGEAQATPFDFKNALKATLGELLLTIQGIIGQGVAWASGLAQGLLNWGSFQKAQMVQDGWGIVRDLTNLFFALVLLIIAFATILRLETYGMKQLLWKLIVAALLINFSLVIAGVFVDFSNVLTDFFLEKGGKNEFFTNIASTMGLPKTIASTAETTTISRHVCLAPAVCISKNWDGVVLANDAPCRGCSEGKKCCVYDQTIESRIKWEEITDTYWKVIAALFLSILFSLIAFIVLALFAFLLLIRILAIWFLLIIAPIVWLLWILPATAKLFSQWWHNFIKWCFFAPIAVFFLYLAVQSWMKFIQGKATGLVSQEAIDGMKQILSSEMVKGQLMPQVMAPENLIQFFLVCGILIGTLIVAQKMGVAGADAAIGVGKFLALGAGRGLSRWAAKGAPLAPEFIRRPIRRALEKVPVVREITKGLAAMKKAPFMALSPQVWSRAMAQRRARADLEAFPKAAGALDATLEAFRHPILYSKGKRTFYKEKAYASEVAKLQDDIDKHMPDEDQRVQAALATTKLSEKEAFLRSLAKTNSLNNYFLSMGKDLNERNYVEHLRDTFGDDEAARIAGDIRVIGGYGAGNWMLAGGSKWHPQKHKMVLPKWDTARKEMVYWDDKSMGEFAAARAREVDVGKLASKMHPEAFFDTRNQLHDTGKSILRTVPSVFADRVATMQPRTIEALHRNQKQILDYAQEIERMQPQQAAVIRKVVNQVTAQRLGKGAAEAEDIIAKQMAGEIPT